MKTRTLVLAVILAAATTLGQASENRPLTLQGELPPLDTISVMNLPALDRDALLAEDAEREARPGVAPRFAIPREVDISVDQHGRWEQGNDGLQIWRYRIEADEARSLNLAFAPFNLPEGASLHLFSSDGKYRIRTFTSADNNPANELWTPVIEGSDLVIELQVTSDQVDQVELAIASINQGYRGFFEPAGARSGSCNVDVVCPEGDDWQDEIASVAVISTGGDTFCTGFMVNNVEFDGTPFFMTADHCGIGAGNAASLVTYWNYENSTCREPDTPGAGGPGDGSLDEFNTGSTFRASRGATDFTLVELFNEPDPEWEVTYAGWDARDQATDWAIGIHHPRTQEKRISFELDPTSITDYLSDSPNPNETHIRVGDWDIGTTEPGSSGSPLFNPDGQVIGQLHGGYAACGNNLPDWYGRIALSWDAGGSASTRLRDWLDPNDTGTLVIDGLGGVSFGLAPEATAVSQCSFDDLDISIDVTQLGDVDDPVTLSVDNLPAAIGSMFSTNPVTPPGFSTLTLTSLADAGVGTYEFVLHGDNGESEVSVDMSLTLSDQSPDQPVVNTPADGAVGVSISPEVEWTAADQAFEYELEIATDSGFNDLVYTASVHGTSHQVDSELDTNSSYYLRVRAVNDCGEGTWSEINAFSTEALPGDCPLGTQTESLLEEDFGAGSIPADWSTDGSSGAVTWVASTEQSHSAGHSVFAENISSVSDQRLATPQISLPDGVASMYLNFQNWQHIESGGPGCFDGGLLEVSTNDGASWSQVENEHILVREYDGPISGDFDNPLGGQDAWCGDPRDEWERYAIDLSAWQGEDVRFRFRFGTDSSVSRVGWYVDSVEVLACLQDDPVTVGGTVEGLEGTGLVLQNNAGDDLTISEDGPFTFASTLFPGQDYAVTVSEQPSDPNQYCEVSNGQGVVDESDIDDVLVSCQTLGVLAGDPPEIDFGEIPEGGMATDTVTVSNAAPAGAMSLDLASLTISGDAAFAISGGDCQLGQSLAPQQECQVEVRFEPTQSGPYSGALVVEADDGQQVTTDLMGEGIELDPGIPDISPQSLPFGSVPTNLEETLAVTVSNLAPEGSADLSIGQASVISGQDAFSVDDALSDCGATLAPESSCTLVVRFSPPEEQSYSGVLRLVIDGANHNLGLSGQGAEVEPDIFHDRFEDDGS